MVKAYLKSHWLLKCNIRKIFNPLRNSFFHRPQCFCKETKQQSQVFRFLFVWPWPPPLHSTITMGSKKLWSLIPLFIHFLFLRDNAESADLLSKILIDIKIGILYRDDRSGLAGWAYIELDFGIIEGAASQRQRAAPHLTSQIFRPCSIPVIRILLPSVSLTKLKLERYSMFQLFWSNFCQKSRWVQNSWKFPKKPQWNFKAICFIQLDFLKNPCRRWLWLERKSCEKAIT